ncbi:protein PET100 homolog, mitochondrial isoform X1 [Petromyzon marinus]|uniref:protein PET100 homolog, mitochondrial isoform X1 n=1 Tax=Petromyzon marinus TaxID=7757 RepID=UPI003F72B34D
MLWRENVEDPEEVPRDDWERDTLNSKYTAAAGVKMMLYLSFPVAMFWVSNQAEYFEEYVVKRKKEIFPANESKQREELERFKQFIQMEQAKKHE